MADKNESGRSDSYVATRRCVVCRGHLAIMDRMLDNPMCYRCRSIASRICDVVLATTLVAMAAAWALVLGWLAVVGWAVLLSM